MKKFRLLSLNVRIWTKSLDPRKWEQWWLPRTIKMRRLFRKGPKDLNPEETWIKPDIICLQERIYPLGKLLLGLWGYKACGSRKSRLPVYLRRKTFRGYEIHVKQYCGTVKENGHGHTFITFINKSNRKYFSIQNSHFSFNEEDVKREIQNSFYGSTIFCGDFNLTKDKFMKVFRKVYSYTDLVFFDKEPKGAPTYRSFEKPDTSYSDIDQFGYVKFDDSEFSASGHCTIFPDRLSDHYPILVEIEI